MRCTDPACVLIQFQFMIRIRHKYFFSLVSISNYSFIRQCYEFYLEETIWQFLHFICFHLHGNSLLMQKFPFCTVYKMCSYRHSCMLQYSYQQTQFWNIVMLLSFPGCEREKPDSKPSSQFDRSQT